MIRADAGLKMGTGHVMRCLALAQQWKEIGGESFFVMSMWTKALESRLRSEGFELVPVQAESGSEADAYAAAEIFRQKDACFLAIDGYQFGEKYQKLIKNLDVPSLFVDDNGDANHYYADIVLNQNVHADEKLYRFREPYTELLLGTKYILLRREFLMYRNWNRNHNDEAINILVTFGGSDPLNTTSNVIKLLDESNCFKDKKIVVVIGGSSERHLQLQSLVKNQNWIQVKKNVTNMPELMAWADMAVSAAGSTVWELAFMALPSIIMIVADNQRKAAFELDRIGCCKLASEQNLIYEANNLSTVKSLRLAYSQSCKNLVDGDGSKRVIAAICRKLEDKI